MGVELYVFEAVDSSVSHSFVIPDANGDCLCFPPFLFHGCAPERCSAFHVYELVVHLIPFIYISFFFVHRVIAANKLETTAANIYSVIAIFSLLLIVVRQCVVLGMTTYTPSKLSNYLLFATELDSTEPQLYGIAYGIGPVAALVFALAVSAQMRLKKIVVYIIIGCLYFAYLPQKIFPAYPKGPERLSQTSSLGLIGALAFLVGAIIFAVFSMAVRQKLKRFAGERQERTGDTIKRICLRALLIFFTGSVIHLVYSQVLFKAPYDFTVEQYIVFRYVKTTIFAIAWSTLAFDLESGRRGKQTEMLEKLRHTLGLDSETKSASLGSESVSVGSESTSVSISSSVAVPVPTAV